ncbi:MAG TPA: hypothetical protein VF351_10230 [Actinomycetota bacterium]
MSSRPRPVGIVALLAALTIAGAAACAGSTDAPAPSADSPSKDPVVPSAGGNPSSASEGTAEVLRFTAPRLEGGTVRGEDYSGADVAFWFWAPW